MPDSYEDALLNTFAIRSFRDTADRDYVHARLAFKAHLIPQFQWSSLHCLEKYAKCILLLNRIAAKQLRHEISGALDLIAKKGTFKVHLSAESLAFINRLENEGAKFRYFETSYGNDPNDIAYLDLTVSELRRYCQPLNRFRWNKSESSLQSINEVIAKETENHSRNTCITYGWIERILENTKHPARAALVWQNGYFGSVKRKEIKLNTYIEAGISPLDMNPELVDEVLKYVYLPKQIVNEWRENLKPRAENS